MIIQVKIVNYAISDVLDAMVLIEINVNEKLFNLA
jgi:hypothetical protein